MGREACAHPRVGPQGSQIHRYTHTHTHTVAVCVFVFLRPGNLLSFRVGTKCEASQNLFAVEKA